MLIPWHGNTVKSKRDKQLSKFIFDPCFKLKPLHTNSLHNAVETVICSARLRSCVSVHLRVTAAKVKRSRRLRCLAVSVYDHIIENRAICITASSN